MSHRHVQALAHIADEYQAARVALLYLEREWSRRYQEPECAGLRRSDARAATANLEGTYLIRVFSAFEGLLRHYFAASYPGHRIPGTTEALINRVALRERLPDLLREGVHRVREYRNDLVHPGRPTRQPLPLAEAISALNRFLAPLPDPP